MIKTFLRSMIAEIRATSMAITASVRIRVPLRLAQDLGQTVGMADHAEGTPQHGREQPEEQGDRSQIRCQIGGQSLGKGVEQDGRESTEQERAFGPRGAPGGACQRAINILLGSALATISLTVPAVLMIGLVIDRSVELGLDPVEMLLLLLTLAVSTLTFTGGRTSILQGAIHLVLFFAFIVLIFNP